ncbi:MAG: ScyD/ScyE family protein [Anaerolineae bacterium]|nr:ScyD/ScyE family protein [Anaerolineae bacterium]
MKRKYLALFAGLFFVTAVGLLLAPWVSSMGNPSATFLNAHLVSGPVPTIQPLSPNTRITTTQSITSPNSPSPTNLLVPARALTSTNLIPSEYSLSLVGLTANNSTAPVVDVKIQNFVYVPSPLTIPAGTTVKWTQMDSWAPHTVSAGSAAKPDYKSPLNSGPLTVQKINTFEFTFQAPGSFSYYCLFHPEMNGLVVVTAAQPTAPTPKTATPTPARTATAASPTASLLAGAQIVATELINPRGFTQGPDGALYVAEAGTVPAAATLVAPTASSTALPSPQPSGTPSPICSSQLPGYDTHAANCPDAPGPQTSRGGRISRIAPDGTRTTVAENLPATIGPFHETFGVNSVAFVGRDLYAIIAAGAARGHPDFPTGVYRVTNAKTTLVADLEEFQRGDPPKFIADDPNSSLPNELVSQDEKLYVTDGNAAAVFEIDPSQPPGKNVKRIVDLSPTHNVLTGISAGADGAIYFIGLNPASYPAGGAQIFKWTPQGGLKTITAGLGIATGLALAPDGSIYAAEFATDLAKPPAIVPPGRVVKIGANGRVETVATPLVYPTSLRWLDGALYVTNYGVNGVEGEEGNGEILRLAVP